MFEIDKAKPIPELDLSLAKPNEETIGNLTEVHNRDVTLQLGRFNEMSFTVPKYIMRKHKRVLNPNYNNILERYLVKATYGDIFSEWMIVTNISKSKSNIPEKKITLKSRQYELNRYYIRNYKVEPKNPREVMEVILEETNWTIGTIDEEIMKKYRSFEETNISVLNMLYKLAEKFIGMLQFDTFNRTVSLFKQEDIEVDEGLFVSHGKYIKTVGEDSDGETITTRLYVYGKDDVSINEVNPTGTSYIEDYSYFMEGYETDADGNVISSSPYMSDELCQAIIDYNIKLINRDGDFKNLIKELKPIQDELVLRQNELFVLNTELSLIEDRLDIAKAASEPYDDILSEREQKREEIADKESEIEEVESRISTVENKIKELRNDLSQENNFTEEQIKEIRDYVYVAEWKDENYHNIEELYEEGKEKLRKQREPKRDLKFSLIQFLETVEAQRDWDRVGLGYVIRVDYEPTDIAFKAIISEIKIGFDNRSLDITVSNVDYKSDKQEFVEMLYRTAISTSQKLEANQKDWYDAVEAAKEFYNFVNNPIDAVKHRIQAGVRESVTFDGRGLKIKNPDFPEQLLVAQSGVLALSLDGGETWETGITPFGIVADVVRGDLLLGEKLIIKDPDGTFQIKGNLLTIKDRDEIVRVLLGEYDEHQFGLKLMNKTGREVVLDENGILQTWQEGRADNVDRNNGLTLHVYLPEDTLSIRQAILNFKLLPFRSYSGTTESGGQSTLTSTDGGATTATSSSGGGTTATSSSGGGTSKSTASGGASTETSSGGGNHTHRMWNAIGYGAPEDVGSYTLFATGDGTFWVPGTSPSALSYRTAGASGNHTHSVKIPAHAHNFTVPEHAHSVTIKNHDHTVNIPNHNHKVTLPAHTHDIAHGIYTSTKASGVGIKINGVDVTEELGGKFNVDMSDISIKEHLYTGQWNEITLTSEQLGRIDASIFVQAFMGT